MEVAVALLPIGKTVAGHRLHLHVGRQQVVASVRPMRRRVVDEHFGVVSLPEQAAVMIGEAHDHGLDEPASHEIAQLVERQASAMSRCVSQGVLILYVVAGPHPRDLCLRGFAARHCL